MKLAETRHGRDVIIMTVLRMPTRDELTEQFLTLAPALRLYAAQIVSPDIADDLIHDLLVKLLVKPPAMENFRSYLFSSVRNDAISAMRSKSRRLARDRSVAPSEFFESRIDDLIDAAAARQALESLPPSDREIVVLRIYAQMRFAEIAQVLGCAVSTAHDRYRDALAKLRNKLEKSDVKRTPTQSC